jgi:signal transduction histidine kinase
MTEPLTPSLALISADLAAAEPADVLARAAAAEDTLRAIAAGEIDAFVVPDAEGRQRVFTLATADRPYRMILESMRDGAATVSSKGTILYVNARLAELLSCSKETIVGAPLARFVTTIGGVGAGRDGLRAGIEGELLTADGVAVAVLVGFAPLELDGEQLTCLTFTDLRTVKPQNRDVEPVETPADHARRQGTSQQSERLANLGQNAVQTAHDFNNLLASIQGYAASIKLEVDDAAAERERHMVAVTAHAEQIEHSALLAANLTRRLLTFVRGEIVRPEIMDLNDLVVDLEETLRRTVGPDVELLVRLDRDVQSVRADREQLERALMNLVVNARDAMPGGGIINIETSNVEIDEHDASLALDLQPGQYVRLAVTDTGTGMTDAVMDRAFEAYFTTKEDRGGTGLGLAAVHGTVSLAGGHVQIDSEPAVGTTITVLLPANNWIVLPRIKPIPAPRVET